MSTNTVVIIDLLSKLTKYDSSGNILLLGQTQDKPEQSDYNFPVTIEGRKKLSIHFKKERDLTFMKKCKELYSLKDPFLSCEICGFSFVENYGEIGGDFIEGHHEKPIKDLTEETLMNFSDIRMVCSNCHSMIHSRYPCYSIDEMKEIRMGNG